MVCSRGHTDSRDDCNVHYMPDGKNPECLNGGWNIKYTKQKSLVTCKVCQEKINWLPSQRIKT